MILITFIYHTQKTPAKKEKTSGRKAINVRKRRERYSTKEKMKILTRTIWGTWGRVRSFQRPFQRLRRIDGFSVKAVEGYLAGIDE